MLKLSSFKKIKPRTFVTEDGSKVKCIFWCVLKNGWEYYFIEAETNTDDVVFCYVLGHENEFGDVSLSEVTPYLMGKCTGVNDLYEIAPPDNCEWAKEKSAKKDNPVIVSENPTLDKRSYVYESYECCWKKENPIKKNDKVKELKNKKMNDEVYAMRRRVMDIIYSIKKEVDIPRIDVRITDGHEKILGMGRMNNNIIWISEDVMKYNDSVILRVVLHEILHAVHGIEHVENCPLMDVITYSKNEYSKDELVSLFKKYAKSKNVKIKQQNPRELPHQGTVIFTFSEGGGDIMAVDGKIYSFSPDVVCELSKTPKKGDKVKFSLYENLYSSMVDYLIVTNERENKLRPVKNFLKEDNPI